MIASQLGRPILSYFLAWVVLVAASLGRAAPYEWTWVAGSSTAGLPEVYGTKGVAALGNRPADGGVSGRDSTGKVWLYSNNNVWRYDPATGFWTWLNGEGAGVPAANWGTKGVEAPTNHPGSRILAIMAWDQSGRLWLYGGARADINGQTGDLNDLWRYDGNTNQWTWMTGGNVRFSFSGTYGTRNVAAASNHPGARNSAAATVDAQGRFLFFGGNGQAPMADLWRYDPTTNWWTWIGGSSSTLVIGVYGTQGVPSTSNRIGSRRHGTTLWTREDGTVWLFGGFGFDSNSSMFEMPQNDLWRFQPATNEWTWMAGSSLGNFTTNMNGWRGTYGTKGVEAAANTPGSRVHAGGVVDAQGQLWLIGGNGLDAVEPQSTGNLNDVWRFSPQTGQWAWMAGSDLRGQAAVFGTLGVPAPANTPFARTYNNPALWHDPSGSLRFIGGGGTADIWSFELPVAPEIRVTRGVADVVDGLALQVTDAPSGGSSQTVLTITNTGTSALTSIAASLSGTHAAEYSLTGPAVTTLAAGESTTITIAFTPAAAGQRTAALSITSNDTDENPYDIALSGIYASPEIAVEQPVGTNLTDGSGSLSLPTTNVGSSSAATTFTIRNTGSADLSGISITKDGSHPGDFSVSTPPATIAPGGSATFTVTFSPALGGTRTSAIHITSNDADENPFDISLTATGNGPEIGVEYPTSTPLVDGVSSVTLPATNVGSSSTVQTFTVRNTGNTSLTGISITKDGANSAEFTVSTPVTSISAGSSATFTVTFSPIGAGGARTAAIHIASNDFDENPFDITLNATANAPEIVVEQPVGSGLTDGAATLTFLTTNVSSTSAATTVTIRNTGTGPLTGISLSKTGTSSAEFNVSTPVTSLAAGASTTFTITFAPAAGGTRTAALLIASNDLDENPFDITLTGTGNAPEIEIEQPVGTVLVDGVSTVTLPAAGVGATSTQSTFTVRNLGIAPLTGFSITKDGTNSADFSVSSPGTSIARGESAIFNVTFAPSAVGTRTAAIHFFSNDSNESPFDIALTGQGLTPPPGAVDLSSPINSLFPQVACMQPDGKILLGGGFSSVLGTPRNRLARLNANETLDFGFDPGANNSVTALTVQMDGKILVGGSFPQIAGASRNYLARLNPDGSLDSAFDPGVNGDVWSLTLQRDGKVIIAGSFNAVAGTTRNYMARLNADGSLDTTFNPSPSGDVFVTRVLPDGKIYAGGYFGTIGGLGRLYLARLNPDGTADPAFNANVNSYVIDIAPLPQGKVMIGGYFSLAGGASRARIARLEANGSADPAFTIGTGGGYNYVLSLLPQADGKVIVSGEFASIGVHARSNIGRVNPDNTVDLTFNPNPQYGTSTPLLLKSGQLFISGDFPARSGLVRLINDPATESLVIDSTSKVRWLRSGSSPEANSASFELSSNGGATWQPLGYGERINGGWEINALSLPASGQIRARAYYTVSGYQKTSGSMAQTLQSYSGAVDKPEIALEQPASANLLDGGSRHFGDVLVGTTSEMVFTLKNTGNTPLTGLSLTKDGPEAAQYTVSAIPTSLAAQSSTTFTVTFAPTGTGAPSAAIHIASNDEDENPFDLTLSGFGLSPEISVENSFGALLNDGVSTINLPTTSVGSNSAAQTLTIVNMGTAPLTGISITKDGANGAEFTVSTPVTSLAVGAAATFTVAFSPTGSGGARSAAIHIASSDLDENPFTIALTGTANAPEIEVEQPAGSGLVDGASTVDYGPVLVGSNLVRTFTIRNSGALTLSGLSLSKAGTDSANFTLGSLSVSSLAAGATTTFTVTFAPGATVTRNAIVRVASNDFDENPFDIAVTGVGVVPEIAIEQPVGTNLTDGVSTVTYGAVNVGGNVTQSFTVRNTGASALTGLALSKAGTNTADFTLGTLSVTTLNPGESTAFDVTFAPQAYGSRSAILRVASSDADENPFDITLTGTGLATEIVVEQPVGTNVGDGGSRSFGSVLLGGSASLSFTIKNIGNIDLTDLSITKDGANAEEFTITASPTAPVSGPSGSTTFTVQFTPTALGLRSAAIHIASNDIDESPFDILLTGTGTSPEIVVEYPAGTGLQDGVSVISLPTTNVASLSNITVTLRNTGTATLTGISISKDGDHSSDFGVSTPATVLNAGSSATFSVSFTPTALGTRSAAIHISSSDLDENPFDIVLTGTGTSPEVEIEHPAGVGLVDGVSSIDYGPLLVGSTQVKTFTVRNTGTSSLTSLALSKTGTNSSLFTLSSLSTTTLAIGASTTFTVTYAPNAVAAHGATIRLSSNDLDESPFDIAVTGSGIAPEIAIEAPVGTNLIDNGSTITFPATVAGSSSDPVIFTVRNTGSAPLAGLALSKVGTNTADFLLGTLGATSLAPTESTTFTVIFSPTAGGTRSATLRVASNDTDENPFDIALSGTATAPTISIEQPANFALTSGSSVIDFGELPPGSPIGRSFRIRNTGTAPLTNLVLTKAGANPGDFSIGTPATTTIAPGAFTTVSVIFNPVDGGYRSAILNIASNATNVSNFIVNLTGAGLGPEIVVTTSVPYTTLNLVDGDYQLDLLHCAVGDSNYHTVIIRNDGLLDLTNLAITFTGTASTEFSVPALTTTTLAPGQSTAIYIYFNPLIVGERLATIHIASNDYSESSFEIGLKGTGLTRYYAWSLQYFGFWWPGYPPFLLGEYEDHQDPDGDGITNLMEFATGQHPLNSTTPVQSFTRGTGGECIFTYQRSKAAVADGLLFTVQHNATLDPAGWSSLGVTETILSDDGTLETVQATIPAPTGSACFTRLRVQRP
ncbi:MAG: choice-of-anchor D domain-containing protein [Verrucomicrobiaceae bacterium]|nr:choice-of-anchor D domain-containing protein [Verrucomicrobiaceae bacterium]